MCPSEMTVPAMSGPVVAVLPAMMELRTMNSPSASVAPTAPPWAAELPVIVEWDRWTMASELTASAPPRRLAVLPLKVQLVMPAAALVTGGEPTVRTATAMLGSLKKGGGPN